MSYLSVFGANCTLANHSLVLWNPDAGTQWTRDKKAGERDDPYERRAQLIRGDAALA